MIVCHYWIVYLVTQLARAMIITIYITTAEEEGADSYKSHFTLHSATTLTFITNVSAVSEFKQIHNCPWVNKLFPTNTF